MELVDKEGHDDVFARDNARITSATKFCGKPLAVRHLCPFVVPRCDSFHIDRNNQVMDGLVIISESLHEGGLP